MATGIINNKYHAIHAYWLKRLLFNAF